MPAFNGAKFLRDNFTDYASLCSMLQAYGFETPKSDTARKWFTRGNIPGEWFPTLLAALEIEQGGAVCVRTWIET